MNKTFSKIKEVQNSPKQATAFEPTEQRPRTAAAQIKTVPKIDD